MSTILSRQKHTFRVFFALFVGVTLVVGGAFLNPQPWLGGVTSVYAVDDEEEEDDNEDDDEDEEDEDDWEEEKSSSQVKSEPIYKTVVVTKIITTLDPVFTVDQDGDKVVDGLDPHPDIPEERFFTDDDDDSVPNAFDIHPDEDDFAYYETESDANGNGILDSYEFMEER